MGYLYSEYKRSWLVICLIVLMNSYVNAGTLSGVVIGSALSTSKASSVGSSGVSNTEPLDITNLCSCAADTNLRICKEYIEKAAFREINNLREGQVVVFKKHIPNTSRGYTLVDEHRGYGLTAVVEYTYEEYLHRCMPGASLVRVIRLPSGRVFLEGKHK